MTIGAIYPAETYSPEEQERLKEFRAKIADLEVSEEMLHDAQLVRWLRARSLDVGKAYDMLKLSLEWRRENKVDGILEREDVPQEVKQHTPFADLGLDKDGYPILLIPMGRQDGRTMLEKYGPEQCFRYNTINCEKVMGLLQKLSKEQGREVTQIMEIIDLEGYNYRQLTSKLCRDFMIKMQTTFDANYPEMLRYCLVINAPKIFHILFNLMKPFIPKQTLEKVDIYGPEPEKWKKVMAERFPLECIPRHWGGTRKGSDEYCSKDKIWIQGPVSLSFFNSGKSVSDDEDEDSSNLEKVTINARDSLKIRLAVTNPGSSITWRLKTESRDVGFQIVDEDGKEVVPYSRAQPQKQVHEGSVDCQRLGTYTVIFDNTYSLARSKTISYSVSVIGEGEEEEEEVNSNYEVAEEMVDVRKEVGNNNLRELSSATAVA